MRYLIMLSILSILACAPNSQGLKVTSPDGDIAVAVEMRETVPYYAVTFQGREIIQPSRLGMVLQDGPSFDELTLHSSSTRSADDTWTQPWGQFKEVRNHFNELALEFQTTAEPVRSVNVVFRVFDDGVGFRYEWPDQENLSEFHIMDELTEFKFDGNHNGWWIEAYQPERYEYLYQNTSVAEMPTVHTPATFETPAGDVFAIHEAALTDFASMTLKPSGELTFEADLVPWSDGVKVRATVPHVSPWRTIQIGENAGELLTSTMIINLNEPNVLDDISWVKPGKYVGIWWGMHLNKWTWGSGPNHGATTENTLRYMEFAAENGFSGVLVEGWNLGWDGNWYENGDIFNFTQPYPDFDIERVTEYANENGITLIGHHETGAGVLNYESQLEDAFQLYNRLGVRAVKTGYVGQGQCIRSGMKDGKPQLEWHHGQFMVRHYRKVVETAAKYGVMVNTHEPIKATGIRRTYPNMMTREGARGQEYNAWSPDGGNPPDHTTILPFTRLLGGPFDHTPGIFDLTFEKAQPNNRVNTTLAKQLALYVTIYSPLHMAADLIVNYEDEPAFQFIRDVSTDWETTIALNAKIGDYVSMVRKDRNSDDWYLGSITDEDAREFEFKLDFLEKGVEYTAEMYLDADETDWQTTPHAINITSQTVTSETVLPVKLAAGGGAAIRFTPNE